MATNGHTLYFGTANGLYVGEPGTDGYSARPIGLEGTGDFRAPVVVDCRDKSVLYAGTNKAGMFRSRDGGKSWHDINEGLLHKTVWSIAQDIHTGNLYVGASPASVFVSTDQGDTWKEFDALERLPETRGWTGPVPPHVSRLKSLAFSNDSPPVIYGAIEEGWAVRSVDGGETWEQIAAEIVPDAHDGHSVVVIPDDPGVVIVGTGRGMFRSTNRGEDFEPVSQGLEKRRYTPSPLVGHPDKPGYLLTAVTATGPGGWNRPEGGDSGFARSEDGGLTWTVSTKGLPEPCISIPRGLAIAADDPDVCVAGMTDGTVWMSHDAGDSFTKVLDGLPPVLSVTVA